MKSKTYFIFPLFILQVILLTGNLSAQVAELTVQTGHTSSIYKLCFSRDGKLLASADQNNKVNVWHLATGGQMSGIYFPKEQDYISSISFSPSGELLAVLAGSMIYVYYLPDSREYFSYRLDFKPNNICFGNNDTQLFISGVKTCWLNTQNKNIVTLTDKASYKIMYDQKTDKILVLSTRAEVFEIDVNGQINGYLAHDKITRIFTGKNPFVFFTGFEKYIPDFNNQSIAFVQASRFGLFSYRSGKRLYALSSEYVDKVFNAVAISEKYNLILGANDDGKIYVGDYQTGKLLKKLKSHYSEVYDVVFSPDQEIFASCSRDRSVIIWESKTLKPVKRLYSRAFSITSLNKSNDENLLIFGNETGFTRVIDVNSAVVQMQSIRNHQNQISDLCFLPGDTMALTCAYDNKVSLIATPDMTLLNRKTFKELFIPRYLLLNTLQNLGFYIEPFCFPDTIVVSDPGHGKYIVSGYRRKLKASRKKNEAGVVSYEHKRITYLKQFVIPDLKSSKITGVNIEKSSLLSLEGYDVYHPAFGHKAEITGVVQLSKHQLLATSSLDGTIKLWDMSTKTLRITIIPIDRDKKILMTADNFYLAPREALPAIGFKQGLQFFPPQQFDIHFNRPDIVLSKIGIASSDLINAYHNAYLKRLKKLNLAGSADLHQLHLPEIEIINQSSIPLITTSGNIQFSVRASDNLYFLNRLNVFLNDVPVFGSNGIDIQAERTHSVEKTINVELSAGKNKIQVSVINDQGAESLKATFIIDYQRDNFKPDLYLLTIGTSTYRDERFNLNYAAKDARDVAALFKNARDIYKNIFIKTLTDKEVTRDGILEMKAFLNQAKIDDVVIVFAAGHGLLDEAFNYYFGTYDIDFNQPSVNGITYDELGSLLDGLKALKKLLILDTCHSGELDKDDVEKTDQIQSEEGLIAFRSAGAGIRNKEGFGFKNITELTNQLFADLRQGSGATVISSSGGVELSMESKNWQNGLFTFCLLEGLTSHNADLNKDRKIMVSELQKYIKYRTSVISQGKQVPTARSENISLDFRIW